MRCAWCEAELGPASTVLAGRTVCAVCGAATTDPWPSDEELGGGLPHVQARVGALLGRRRRDPAAHASPLRRHHRPPRSARPGARRRLRGRHAARCAPCRRARGASGSSASRTAPTSARATSAELGGEWAAIVFWHSLEHLRAPGPAVDAASRLLAPGGLICGRDPEHGQPAGARLRRPLVPPRPAPPPGPPAGGGADDAAAGARAAGHPRQPLAGGPGAVRLAPRPRRLASREAGPLRRDPPPRGAQRSALARTARRDPDGGRPPLAAGRRCDGGRGRGPARRDRLR